MQIYFFWNKENHYGIWVQTRTASQDNQWFLVPNHMMQFLKKYFSANNGKEYYCMDAADTAQLRIKLFFIVRVFSKGISKKALSDANSHSILSGGQYTEVEYWQKQDEKKHIVRYHHPKTQQNIFIHMAEIFVSIVVLNEDLCMDIYKYQSIFHAAHWFIYLFIETFSQLFSKIY